MDRNNIHKTVISISAPGTHLVHGDHVLGATVTRDANEYMSSICKQRPDRFAFFASLPLPAVKDSLAEIDYAHEKLGAAGFALVTNVHGTYPGHPSTEAIFARLNELGSIVFIHPTNCHHVPLDGTTPQIVAPLALPGGVLEYVFDTIRCLTNLIFSGTVSRYPHIRWVIPHCGSALASLLERISGFGTKIMKKEHAMTSEEMKKVFNERFWFDLAGFPFLDLVVGMLRVVGPERLMYGTDFPYLNGDLCTELREVMDKGLEELFDEETVQKIMIGNAEALLGVRSDFVAS
jgi:predicted TIM-barrel fold metal-dependent hydrolase